MSCDTSHHHHRRLRNSPSRRPLSTPIPRFPIIPDVSIARLPCCCQLFFVISLLSWGDAMKNRVASEQLPPPAKFDTVDVEETNEKVGSVTRKGLYAGISGLGWSPLILGDLGTERDCGLVVIYLHAFGCWGIRFRNTVLFVQSLTAAHWMCIVSLGESSNKVFWEKENSTEMNMQIWSC